MAVPYSGTATIGTTTHSLPNNSTTLTPITVEGTYQAVIDFGALALGDLYQVEVLEKAVSGGTQRSLLKLFVHGLSGQNLVLPAVRLVYGWDIQVKKVSGTDRSISWSIRTPG